MVGQPLLGHPLGHDTHHLDGVHVTDVMATSKLVDVAVEMCCRDVVEGAVVATAHEHPQGFHAVNVGLAPDVFFDRVVDRLVVGWATISGVLISVGLGAGADVGLSEVLESDMCGLRDGFGPDGVCLSRGP